MGMKKGTKVKQHKRKSKNGKVFIAGRGNKIKMASTTNPYVVQDHKLLNTVEQGNTGQMAKPELNELQSLNLRFK